MRASNCANTKTKDSEAAKIGRPTDNHIRAHRHTRASLQHGWKYCVVEGRESTATAMSTGADPCTEAGTRHGRSECQSATTVTGANS